MQTESMWKKFDALPPKAQKQVGQFIDLLQSRYVKPKKKNGLRANSLFDDEFVGVWEDRKEMADSSLWVKNLRQAEWGK